MNRRKRRAGLTLVETALLFSIMGTLLAVAVPTFVATVQTSKVAEASQALESIYQGAASYYETSRLVEDAAPAPAVGSVAPGNAPKAPRHAFCMPAAAGPAPERPSVRPVQIDFQAETTPGAATWRAIGFHPTSALRYRYTWAPGVVGCSAAGNGPAASVLMRAEGDLDGDGVYSRFERTAVVTAPGELTPDPVLHVHDRVE